MNSDRSNYKSLKYQRFTIFGSKDIGIIKSELVANSFVQIMLIYITTNCVIKDLHMVEMEDFKYGGTNITAFRLVNPSSELVQGVIIHRKYFLYDFVNI